MKKIYVFVPILLCFILTFVYIVPFVAMSEDISDKVFRLHILANSDTDYDQNLKLMVRDEILKYSNEIYSSCKSLNDAISCTKDNINKYKRIAEQVIKDNGYDYKVNLDVKKEYFNTRVYENFTLPAGYYNSLRIIIGEGKGHNWWCVMYPNVCLSGCVDEFDNELTAEEKNFIMNSKYSIRFKTVEIYEKIKARVKI